MDKISYRKFTRNEGGVRSLDPISDLKNANRVEIFKHLAVDDLDQVDISILDSISSGHFAAFLEFCDQVFAQKDKIQDVSCTLIDGKLQFDIAYK